MKNQLTISLLTLAALAAVLLGLSCAETPQSNTARSNAVNSNAAPSDLERKTAASIDEICSSSPSDKPGKIKEKLERDTEGDDRLNYQYESCQSGCRKERFFFEPVMETNGDATLYIWGSIYIQDKNDDLDNLHKKYKNFLKRGCVTKVVFTPPPTPPTGVTPALIRHFEFTTLCEAPNQVCPDGSCRQDCDRKDRDDNSNMNSNVNPNMNSNSNR